MPSAPTPTPAPMPVSIPVPVPAPESAPATEVGWPARRLGSWAALGALAALLLGGSLMAVAAAPRPPGVTAGLGLALLHGGPAALAALSVLDMFTVPALHQTLRRHGPVLILVATGCALIGDLLGVTGRLTQLSAVAGAAQGWPAPQSMVLDLLQTTLNIAGFLLVSVSFSAFGVLFVRCGARVLGAVAVAAGVLTAAGQLPGLAPLFYLANAAFLAWYAALFLSFRRPEAPGAQPC